MSSISLKEIFERAKWYLDAGCDSVTLLEALEKDIKTHFDPIVKHRNELMSQRDKAWFELKEVKSQLDFLRKNISDGILQYQCDKDPDVDVDDTVTFICTACGVQTDVSEDEVRKHDTWRCPSCYRFATMVKHEPHLPWCSIYSIIEGEGLCQFNVYLNGVIWKWVYDTRVWRVYRQDEPKYWEIQKSGFDSIKSHM